MCQRAEQVQREMRRAATDGVDDDDDDDDDNEYSSGDEKKEACKFDNDSIIPQCHSLSPSSLIAVLSF